MAVAAGRLKQRRREIPAGAGGPRYPAWLALPAVGWQVFFFLCPLAIMGAYSLAELVGFSDIGFGFHLENYETLWDPLYRGIFVRTLGLALFGTLATLLIGFPVAYYLARHATHKTLLLMLLIVPFWTSFLIRTYSWLIILDPDFPLFRALRALGVVADDFSLLYTREAIYIGVAYNYLPIMVLPLYAALERMDWSLVEAAQDLGDSAWQAFRRVTLPLALPGVLAGSLLVFILLTGEYLIPVILGGNKTIYASNLIADQFTTARDWPFGAAAAMVVIAGMTVLVLAYSRIAGREEQHGV